MVTFDNWQFAGLRGLWRGNTVNMLRMIPNKGVLHATNDLYKDFARNLALAVKPPFAILLRSTLRHPTLLYPALFYSTLLFYSALLYSTPLYSTLLKSN